MIPRGVVLSYVRAKSPAARAGLRAGDRLLSIDGQPLEDAIDGMIAIAEEVFDVLYARGTRELRTTVERRPGQEWGAHMEPPPLRHCGNRCIFCFVDQMPKGLRSSLYIKDEDYRHSFLFGNYVTLSNTSPRDLERIRRLRLSPLYISVHATSEPVRRRLLGRARLAPILPMLKQLTKAGIVLHTQTVVCPGVNDGTVLEKTVRDLSRLHPQVRSLAVVPVGLSQHRQALAPLKTVDTALAKRMVAGVTRWQKQSKAELGSRFVYATDEWYLRAGVTVPSASAYEGFPQIENGVGIVRQFVDGLKHACQKLPRKVTPARRIVIPTGTLAAEAVRKALRPLAQIQGVDLEVVPVVNRLFGPSVTVSGLLCGADLVAGLTGKMSGPTRILLASDMVRTGQDVFLDNMSVKELGRRLRAQVRLIASPEDLVRAVVEKR